MKEAKIRRRADRLRISSANVEKDYLASLLLKEISRLQSADSLVFKGGTAIKKMYYPEARFSQDLDFSCQQDVSQEIRKGLESNLIESPREFDHEFTETKEVERLENGVKFKIKYIQVGGGPNSINFDLRFSGAPVLEAKKLEMKDTFSDPSLSSVLINTMALKEIFAEKVRASIAPNSTPRDTYDLWFLLGKGVEVDIDLINKKFQTLKRDKEFKLELLLEAIDKQENDWEPVLSNLLSNPVPSFKEVKDKLLRDLKSK